MEFIIRRVYGGRRVHAASGEYTLCGDRVVEPIEVLKNGYGVPVRTWEDAVIVAKVEKVDLCRECWAARN